MIATTDQVLGQVLTLQCNVTSVMGIMSMVDILWRSNDETLRRTNNINATVVNDDEVYTDSYTTQPLNSSDDRREIECVVVINTETPIRNSSSIELNVTSKYSNI